MFDLVSLIIGLLLGMIIMLLFVWIAYFTRSFLFTYCPIQARPCGMADYFNDPGDALANNPTITADQILLLDDNGRMFYRRVPKNTDCVPEANELVYIQYPQYCMFSDGDGTTSLYKETAFNSNLYRSSSSTQPVVTDGNCEPTAGQDVVTGTPVVKWDANAIS